MVLTEEQRRLIEQKRLEALAKRQAKLNEAQSIANDGTSLQSQHDQAQPPQTDQATAALTDAQKRLIELKRMEAMAKRKAKQNPPKPPAKCPRFGDHQPALLRQSSMSAANQSRVNQLPQSIKQSSISAINGSKTESPKPSGAQSVKLSLEIQLHGSDKLKLIFPFSNKLINVIRQIKSAAFLQTKKFWTVDIAEYETLLQMVRKLKDGGLDITLKEGYVPGRIVSILLMERERRKRQPDIDLKERLSRNFVNKLFPFQMEGIKFGVAKEGRLLIADDMGLGKTVQALGIAEWFSDDWPLLIVAPASVLGAWNKSVLSWLPELSPDQVQIVDTRRFEKTKIFIMSYDRLATSVDDLLRYETNVAIFDESHSIKNDETKRCKAATRFGKSVRRLIMLSGTPALSRPIELYTQISLLNPQLFPSKHDFGVRYCNAVMKFFGRKGNWDYRGYSNTEELKTVLENTIMIRRLKSSVLDTLPPKHRQVVRLSVDRKNLTETQILEMDYFNERFTGAFKGGRGKEMLLEWFQASAKYKVPVVVDYVREMVKKGKKFLCFAYHSVIFDAIADMLHEENIAYVRIDGQTYTNRRQPACDYFQEQEQCKVALVSIVAAGVGLTLTAANYVIFTELYWNPGMIAQAEDRAHRLGQTEPVTVEYLLVNNTVDSWIWTSLGRKLKVLNMVGTSNDKMTAGTRQADQLRIDDLFKKMIKDDQEFNDPDEITIEYESENIGAS